MVSKEEAKLLYRRLSPIKESFLINYYLYKGGSGCTLRKAQIIKLT
jgi:hypothetical protein